MPNTYTQLYAQLVFAVRNRDCLIGKHHREELHKYITGFVQNRDQKMLAIFAMPDHIHMLVALKPNMAISSLVRDIKTVSSKFINEKGFVNGRFSWQEGYGAFSYSKSQIDRVVKYILNQETHHKKRTFKDEYVAFLEKFEIEYEEQYLFDWIE
jgi:putative transposase